MGKIDFNAMKRKEEAAEVSIPEEEESDLAKAYSAVWGKSNETIEYIEVSKLLPYKDKKGRRQPFKINKEKVAQIKLSAEDIGIVTPLLVRKVENGYQILSGHHRYEAAKQLKLVSVPCIIRSVNDDEAKKYVVESNIQRLFLLPTEYGNIFSAYVERKDDLNLSNVRIADKFGISAKNFYRYLNIVKLIQPMQDLFDEEIINLDCSDILVNLTEDDQQTVVDALKELSENGVHVRITVGTAKHIEKLAGETIFNTDDVKKLFEKPVKPYKNKLYTKLSKTYVIPYTEEELDELVENFLAEKFEKEGSLIM
jgi:ParB family chromosome partitioning protein